MFTFRTFFVSVLAFSFNMCFLFAQNTTTLKEDKLARDGFILIGDFDSHGANRGIRTTRVRAFKFKEDENLSYIINAQGYDGYGVVVFPKDQPAFLNALGTILKKFKEWSVVAKDNSITDFMKDIPIDIPTTVYLRALRVDLEKDTARNSMWALFTVDDDGIPFVSVGFNEENPSARYQNHLYDFFSANEIEHLIQILQPSNIAEVYKDTYAKLKIVDRDSLFN